MVNVNYNRLNFNLGIYVGKVICGRNRLWQTFFSITFSEHRLPLKIGRLDEVAVDNSQTANTSTAQQFCLCRTEGTATDDQDSRLLESGLTSFTDFVK